MMPRSRPRATTASETSTVVAPSALRLPPRRVRPRPVTDELELERRPEYVAIERVDRAEIDDGSGRVGIDTRCSRLRPFDERLRTGATDYIEKHASKK